MNDLNWNQLISFCEDNYSSEVIKEHLTLPHLSAGKAHTFLHSQGLAVPASSSAPHQFLARSLHPQNNKAIHLPGIPMADVHARLIKSGWIENKKDVFPSRTVVELHKGQDRMLLSGHPTHHGETEVAVARGNVPEESLKPKPTYLPAA